MRRAEAGVLDHHGQGNFWLVSRRKGDVQRVVTLVFLELARIVFVFLADRHGLRCAGLSGTHIACPSEHACRGAFLRHAHQRTPDHLDVFRFEAEINRRLNGRRGQRPRHAVLGAQNQPRLVLDAVIGQRACGLRQLQHGESVVALANAQ